MSLKDIPLSVHTKKYRWYVFKECFKIKIISFCYRLKILSRKWKGL